MVRGMAAPPAPPATADAPGVVPLSTPALRGPASPWAMPLRAASWTAKRLTSTGRVEPVRVLNPQTASWETRHPAMTLALFLACWGSGKYQFCFFDASQKLVARPSPVEVEHEDHPAKSADFRADAACPAVAVEGRHLRPLPAESEEGEGEDDDGEDEEDYDDDGEEEEDDALGAALEHVAALERELQELRDPVRAYAPPRPPPPPLPAPRPPRQLPRALRDNEALELAGYFRSEALDEAEARIARIRADEDYRRERDDHAHRRALEDAEARHRRHLELLAGEGQLRSGRARESADLRAALERVERRVEELGEEPAAIPGAASADGGIAATVAALAPIVAGVLAQLQSRPAAPAASGPALGPGKDGAS